jgi:hypothetical protein
MENTIPTFLKDVNFIAPAGYTIDYFVTPTNKEETEETILPADESHDYFDVQESSDKATTTVFLKRPIQGIQSTPVENQTIITVPGSYPKTEGTNAEFENNKNIIEGGGSVEAGDRFIKPLIESSNRKVFMLKEKIKRFPKNTLFYCFKEEK